MTTAAKADPGAASFFDRALATWFGCGLVPVAPGTMGALGALVVLPLWWRFGWAPFWFLPLAIALFVPSVQAASRYALYAGRKDPQRVVVDEVLGTWITLGGATVLNWKSVLAAFLLFRLFDIWKPWPVRRLEALPEGLGIVADDCMAGLYGALVLFLAGCFNFY